jgi:hypothetical protein
MIKREVFNQEFPIHDLYLEPLPIQVSSAGSHMNILSRCDDLLRRFGQVSLLDLGPDGTGNLEGNSNADEIWALIKGEVMFHWVDGREQSPTKGSKFSIQLDRPSLALVPFGVQFTFEWEVPGTILLRISSEEKSSPSSTTVHLEEGSGC